ncbi:hypothetical protein JCM11641_007446 [Rhodosporidiobolus odoratus]
MLELSPPTRRVARAVAIASLSGFCFGYDTGSSGSLTTMDSFYAEFGQISETLRGAVVAMILIPSAISGVFAGSISDRLSRKRAISLGAIVFCAGQTMSCAASRYIAILIIGRIIAGLGEGIFLGTLSVYVSEISPKHLRGIMLVVTQTFICLGVTSGFFVCYASGRILHPASLAWRLPIAVGAFVSLCVAIAAPFLPYSPRWLLLHGRRQEAEEVLDQLVGNGPEAQQERRELLASGPAAQQEKGAERSMRTAFMRMWQKDTRWRTILGALINATQMLSGIDFVLFYAGLLFAQAGLDPDTASFLASGVTGVLLILSTFVTATFIHQVGRRPIFLWGGVGIAATLFVLGSMYASGAAHTPVGKWVTIVFIELFAFVFGTTWASVTRLYSSEIQPSRTRAAAASFSQATNQLVNYAVALSGPVFLEKSSYGPYFFYAAFTAAGTLFAFFFMVETKGKSLEYIGEMFDSTRIPLAVPLPAFFSSSSSPLSSARTAITGKVTEHRQRRASRANSHSLGVDGTGEGGVRLRRKSRHNSSVLAEVEAGGIAAEEGFEDHKEESMAREDPRAAFRREMLAVATLGKHDNAIDE